MKSLFIKNFLPPIPGVIAIVGIIQLIDLFLSHFVNDATLFFAEGIFNEGTIPFTILIFFVVQIVLAWPIRYLLNASEKIAHSKY